MTPQPQFYLAFNGCCEEAFRFYAERLGATRNGMFPYGSSPTPDDVPPEWASKIMHGSMVVGGVTISGADVAPGKYEGFKGFRIFLEADDPARTAALFDALSENAVIEMPLQPTFWSVSFGVLTDQFGVPWTIGCTQAPA